MRLVKAWQPAAVFFSLPKYLVCSCQTVAAAKSALAISTPTYNVATCGCALAFISLPYLLCVLTQPARRWVTSRLKPACLTCLSLAGHTPRGPVLPGMRVL